MTCARLPATVQQRPASSQQRLCRRALQQTLSEQWCSALCSDERQHAALAASCPRLLPQPSAVLAPPPARLALLATQVGDFNALLHTIVRVNTVYITVPLTHCKVIQIRRVQQECDIGKLTNTHCLVSKYFWYSIRIRIFSLSANKLKSIIQYYNII